MNLYSQSTQDEMKRQVEESKARAEAEKRQRERQLEANNKKSATSNAEKAGLMGEYGPLANASFQNADGSWSRPDYQSILDQETGLLKDVYNIDNTLNTEGLNKFRGEALRDAGTDSVWAQMALEQNQQAGLQRHDDLASQLNSGQRMAYDGLASSGGLDGGARERVARGGLRELLTGKQGIARDSNSAALDIRMQDEGNRINMLGQLPGMEVQKSQFDADIQNKNVSNSLAERQYGYDQEMNKWNKNMDVWAAEKQAKAQKKASNCFHPDTLVDMADGSKKPIGLIKIGEHVLVGGEVTDVVRGICYSNTAVYDLSGVIVTGDHLVLENDEWIPVKRSAHSKRILDLPSEVVNLVTEDHVIYVDGILFSDNDDVDDASLTNEEAMKRKNEEWMNLKVISDTIGA